MGVAIAAGFVGGWPDGVDRPLDWAGAVLAILGANLVYLAARRLGRSLTPFPRPRSGGELVTEGPFRLARHPIYGGGILFFLGWGLFSTPLAAAAALALAVLWDRKARFEERLLAARYPDYADYRRRTPRRLLPFLY